MRPTLRSTSKACFEGLAGIEIEDGSRERAISRHKRVSSANSNDLHDATRDCKNNNVGRGREESKEF